MILRARSTTKENTLVIAKKLLKENPDIIIPNYSYTLDECNNEEIVGLAYSKQMNTLVLFNRDHWIFDRMDFSVVENEDKFVTFVNHCNKVKARLSCNR